MVDALGLADRLRQAREHRRLSQQAVADALGLPRTAVTNAESGKRLVSTLELTKLAKLYDRPPAWFFGDDFASEDPPVALMRAIGGVEATAELANAVGRVWELSREGAHLQRLLDREVGQIIPSYGSTLTNAGEAARQGEAIAREERGRLGLGDAPVGPMMELLGNQGIWIAELKMRNEISGLFLSDASVGLTVVVNANHPVARRRFSMAHEYGHALFDRRDSSRVSRAENASDLTETRANAFAAAFLMPGSGVADQLRQLGKGRPSRHLQTILDAAENVSKAELRPHPGSQKITFQDVRHLARHFLVSYESVVWRLRNLGVLGASETSPLLDQKATVTALDQILKATPDDKLAPPDDPEQRLPGQLVHLAIEAYRQEKISQGRLRELARTLDVSPDALIALADAAKETAQ